jgi:hypothetical protein
MTVLEQSKENEIAVEQRVDALDWGAAEESLCERGYAVTAPLLTTEECARLVALCDDEKRFRSHIVMERYRFGVGDYKYFENPLPQEVRGLRTAAYPHLATVANRWAGANAARTRRILGSTPSF